MSNTSGVKEAIDKLYSELAWLTEKVEGGDTQEINSAINDVKDAIDNVRDEFDDYNSDIDDVKELIEDAYSKIDKVVG